MDILLTQIFMLNSFIITIIINKSLNLLTIIGISELFILKLCYKSIHLLIVITLIYKL
mgnify:CR=1 FL=1